LLSIQLRRLTSGVRVEKVQEDKEGKGGAKKDEQRKKEREREREREREKEKGPKVTVHDSTLGNDRHRESRAPETF